VLRELQLELSRAFREPSPDGPASRRVLARLRSVGGARPARTLGIYQSALREAVEAALRRIFPICAELVGEGCFRSIARTHVATHASRHPDLGRIGDALPGLVERLDFLASVPYLADVARLELALHAAMDAPAPPPPPDPARLGDALAGAPDRWRLLLDPSVSLLASPHPVRAIWEAHRAPETADGDPWSAVRRARGERLVVRRSTDGPCVEPAPPGLWPILRAIEAGASVAILLALGDAADAEPLADRLQSEASDHEAQLAALSLLFQRGWVTGVEPIPDEAPPASARAPAPRGARDRETTTSQPSNPEEEAST
jgi:hypothetical protein